MCIRDRFHVYGYVEGLLAAVLVGGSILITRGKFDVKKALDTMEQYEANDILSVPSIMMKILQYPGLEQYGLKELHAVYCLALIHISMWVISSSHCQEPSRRRMWCCLPG